MKDGDPASAKLLVIGMAPVREELEHDRPFVGGTGQILFSILKKNGLDRADCLLLNTIAEWPDTKSGPSDAQYAKYWDEFDDVVKSFQGEIVLILGGDALKRFTGLSGGIESWRGYMVKPTDVGTLTRVTIEEGTFKSGKRKGQTKIIKHRKEVKAVLPPNLKWILPTLHPAAVMRTGMTMIPALAADINRAARALKGELRESRTTHVPFGSHECFQPYEVGMPISFDIETAGIGGGLDRLGIARTECTWSAPWSTSVRREAQQALSDERWMKVAHNIAFDLPRLEKAGVPIADPISDTMLMAAMLQPDLPKGLGFVASMYLDGERWKHLSEDMPAYYNARDASATLELFNVLDDELMKSGMHDLFHGIIMPGVREFVRMSEIGLYVDRHEKDLWVKTLDTKAKRLKEEWVACLPNVNPASPTQLKILFYETWGLPPQYDKYGVLTTNELAIRELRAKAGEAEENEVALFDLLLDLRETEKSLKTYADITLSHDGCVHPSYLPAGKDDDRYDPETGRVIGKGLAGTWRPTAKNPNIQNQTKDAKKMYVARTPGHIFWELDKQAFEARILAALSGDKALQRAIDEGLHKNNQELLGVDKVRAKNAFYGWSYGAGAKTLQNTFKAHGYDVPFHVCKAMLRKFDDAYKDAAAWREAQIAYAKTHYYVENPFGLRRYFYGPTGSAPANSPIQSTAALIMWKLMPETGAIARKHGGHQVSMVHDSIEFELPEGSDGKKAMKELRDCANQTFDCVAPGFWVPSTISCGPSWGTVQEIEL